MAPVEQHGPGKVDPTTETMMSTQMARRATRPTRYYERDWQQCRIREAMDAMAETGTQLAQAVGVDKSRISRLRSNWKGAISFCGKCVAAARSQLAEGLALALIPVIEVLRVQLEDLTDAELASLIERTRAEWIRTDCDEQAAMFAREPDARACRLALIAEAVPTLHLAAQYAEIERRQTYAAA